MVHNRQAPRKLGFDLPDPSDISLPGKDELDKIWGSTKDNAAAAKTSAQNAYKTAYADTKDAVKAVKNAVSKVKNTLKDVAEAGKDVAEAAAEEIKKVGECLGPAFVQKAKSFFQHFEKCPSSASEIVPTHKDNLKMCGTLFPNPSFTVAYSTGIKYIAPTNLRRLKESSNGQLGMDDFPQPPLLEFEGVIGTVGMGSPAPEDRRSSGSELESDSEDQRDSGLGSAPPEYRRGLRQGGTPFPAGVFLRASVSRSPPLPGCQR